MTRIFPLLVAACLACVASLPGQHPTSRPETGRPETKGWTGVLDEDAFAALHELKQGKAPPLHGKDITIGEARTRAYLSLPENTRPTAGVLVIHEWWGLNDHIRHWADRLAAEGYAALAVDLYGGKVATTTEAARAAMRAATEDSAATLSILLAGHRHLAENLGVNKRACIGWCFGGGWSLKLAIAAPDLDAAVIYYGRLIDDPAQLAKIRAPILGVFGNRDRGIPPEAVDAFEAAMKKAGKKLTVLRYDADHAFANPSSARYDRKNAAAAWQQVRAFLREHLGTTQHGSFEHGGRRIRYTIPEGWYEKENSSSMRAVTLAAGKASECYVVILNGDGGGLAANLDRWRQQMGLGPLSDDERAALPRMKVLGRQAVRIRIDSGERAMLGAVCPMDGQTLFIKMNGPAAEIAAQERAFVAFCTSLR